MSSALALNLYGNIRASDSKQDMYDNGMFETLYTFQGSAWFLTVSRGRHRGPPAGTSHVYGAELVSAFLQTCLCQSNQSTQYNFKRETFLCGFEESLKKIPIHNFMEALNCVVLNVDRCF